MTNCASPHRLIASNHGARVFRGRTLTCRCKFLTCLIAVPNSLSPARTGFRTRVMRCCLMSLFDLSRHRRILVAFTSRRCGYCPNSNCLARRELVWVNVTAHPTADWITQQISEAFPWDEAPHYLIRDRDGALRLAVRPCQPVSLMHFWEVTNSCYRVRQGPADPGLLLPP